MPTPNPSLSYIYDFKGTPDAATPSGGLILNPLHSGSLIGVSSFGGASGQGAVYELVPPSAPGGVWTENVVLSFNGTNGTQPEASLVYHDGSFYGTTDFGGAQNDGVAFKLTPTASGPWTDTTLYSFSGQDGSAPFGGTFDGSGDIFGVTQLGGANNLGVVYELVPNHKGTGYTETVLHSFTGQDGANPEANLLYDSHAHVLYGTTRNGGTNNEGTVFSLSQTGRTWNETVIHNFNGADGNGPAPFDNLIQDTSGNLYGMTYFGGVNNGGTVFELSPPVHGTKVWSEAVLHSFSPSEGVNPFGSLIMDQSGNLFGTVDGLNGFFNDGSVFELSRAANGGWTEQSLYSFPRLLTTTSSEGSHPGGQIVLDSSGNLFGTTDFGGTSGAGTAYEIDPVTTFADVAGPRPMLGSAPTDSGASGGSGGLSSMSTSLVDPSLLVTPHIPT